MTVTRSEESRTVFWGFWTSTALFCLQISFTAYAQLRLPQVAEAFAHLGFPDYFRVELSWAKLLGVVLLLAPVPARLKEWAYAGFAITLASALIAHLSVGDGPDAWGWAAGTAALWGLSYLFWRRRQPMASEPTVCQDGWLEAAHDDDGVVPGRTRERSREVAARARAGAVGQERLEAP